MNKTSIEWTDTTWCPTRGCRRVSPGCEHCYAEKQALRFSGKGGAYEELVRLGKNGAQWTGKGLFVSEKLAEPLSWRKPRRVFVDSMSDLFFEEFTNEQIAAVFGVMAAAGRHTFQVLTKRPKRAAEWFAWVSREAKDCNGGRGMSVAAFCLVWAQRWADREVPVKGASALSKNVTETCARRWPLSNVWIGVSAEDQQRAEERVLWLLDIPAAVRFVSYEPALGPVDWTRLQVVAPQPPNGPGVWLNALTGHVAGPDDVLPCRINWLIVGGESGNGARPFDVQWAHATVEQCKRAGVPVFVKQLGARCISTAPFCPKDARWGWELSNGERPPWSLLKKNKKGGDMSEWPADLRVREWPRVSTF